MSTLINANIRMDKIPREKLVKGKNGAVYYNCTISISDETRYNNNVAITDSQTKEERDAKKQKNYVGNGKVVWTDSNICVAEQQNTLVDTVDATAEAVENKKDLPF
tara:strand:+ start:6772 stop:7089 length:318 start_codon:yes stop_codon:yes gene_type:complete